MTARDVKDKSCASASAGTVQRVFYFILHLDLGYLEVCSKLGPQYIKQELTW